MCYTPSLRLKGRGRGMGYKNDRYRVGTEMHRARKFMMDIFKSIIVWIIGISYVVVTFPLTLMIWLLTYPFDKERAITHSLLMYESRLLVFLIPIWKIHIEGREKAVKGTTYVIISNHQSLLDTLMINSLRYKYKWISKIENFNVPVIGW